MMTTLFVPGTPSGEDAWRRALDAQGFTTSAASLSGVGLPSSTDMEWVENPKDGSFAVAFSFGTTTDADRSVIESSPGALVLSLPFDLHRERRTIATLGHALASAGALAVRVEQSKAGYAITRWLELIDKTDPWTLHRVAVVVLVAEGEATTCGMHLFSLPDAQVRLDHRTDAVAAGELLTALNVYQLAEDPLLLSGHTFSPDRDTPKRVLHRWPDATYERGHICNNPFGVWRLGASGSAGEPPTKLACVFMPSLVSLLLAREQKAARPLTRGEVEQITSNATVVALEHRDAREMERKRGYTDLDPSRVWDQWQIVREKIPS